MKCFVLVVLAALMASGCAGEPPPVDVVVPLNQLPPDILKAAKKKSPGVNFDTAWKLPTGDYEVSGTTKQGKIRNFRVTPAGEVFQLD